VKDYHISAGLRVPLATARSPSLSSVPLRPWDLLGLTGDAGAHLVSTDVVEMALWVLRVATWHERSHASLAEAG
jgi:hypothetical protein